MAPLVEFRSVEFAYGAPDRRAGRPFRLADLSFAIAPGEIVGVVGPNSAGKTTMIRLLTGVLRPARGEIVIDGRPARRLAPGALARLAAVVPQQTPREFPFTVGELVLMGRYPHAPARFFETAADRRIAREAMAVTDVLELADLPLGGLSGGERQRAVIARALAQEPRLLVLDEPTAHLDLRYQAECVALVRRLNRERGLSVLLVSHDLNLAAELADRVLLLAEGRLVRAGSPEEVFDEALLEAVFGCAVVVEKSPTSRRPFVQVAWPDGRRR